MMKKRIIALILAAAMAAALLPAVSLADSAASYCMNFTDSLSFFNDNPEEWSGVERPYTTDCSGTG